MGEGQKQKRNFAPYAGKKSSTKVATNTSKGKNAWSTRFVCLAHNDSTQVSTSVSEKEVLVEVGQGLGEKKVDIPDIECTANEFHSLLIEVFPKLVDAGGLQSQGV